MPLCPRCRRDAGDEAFCPRDGTPLAHLGLGPLGRARPGVTVDGGYVLEAQVGQGSLATVYRARHREDGALVAVKALRARYARHLPSLTRFAREARSAMGIDHPNVVRVDHLGFQREHAFYYLRMELLTGAPLDEVLGARSPLPLREALEILLGVAAGLTAAHQLQIAHRDLKPANIMVGREEPRVKVMDFGLAKSLEGDSGSNPMTQPGDLLGTPDFMSPEQWSGEPADARADVYAFGVLAYLLLAGALPFDAPSLLDKAMLHRGSPPPRVDAHRRVPESLEAIVAACLRKDRADRPAHLGLVYPHLQAARYEL